MSAADPKFLKLTEEELNREEEERLGMNFKDLSTKILFLITVVGTTWGVMGYLFVTDKGFSQYQRQTEKKDYQKALKLYQWQSANTGFLKLLDKDVQNNKVNIEKNSDKIIVLFRKGSKFETELVKLMARFNMKPKQIEVRDSTPTRVRKAPKAREKIKSRIPSELTQQILKVPMLPNDGSKTAHK